MKKIFLDYNVKDNFGDDLLLKIFCEYFPQQAFTALIPRGRGRAFSSIKNLKIVDINPKNAQKLYKKTISKSEMTLCLGSGQFVSNGENNDAFWAYKTLLKTKPVYFINSDYKKSADVHFDRFVHEYVDDCEGAWFRDKYSAQMFESGQYMPDLSFMTELPASDSNPKAPYAVLALVDLSGRPEISVLHDHYINTMKEVALFLKKQGYKVIILAMCRQEWDDMAAAMLAEYGEIVRYDGSNFNEVLSLINGADCVAGSRLHAITVGIVAGKKIIPIGYDDRFKRLMDDIGSEHPYFDIRNSLKITDESLLEALNYKNDIDIGQIRTQIKANLTKIEKNFIK